MTRKFQLLICADKYLPDLEEYDQVLTYQFLSDGKLITFLRCFKGWNNTFVVVPMQNNFYMYLSVFLPYLL